MMDDIIFAVEQFVLAFQEACEMIVFTQQHRDEAAAKGMTAMEYFEHKMEIAAIKAELAKCDIDLS